MRREISRPSTARCPLPMYRGYLLSEPNSPSGRQLSEVMGISHDSVNRFLQRETYSPQDLFNEVKSGLNLKGGVLSVDDSVLDKPYSSKMAFVGHFWSGKHHRVVKGINVITLYDCDVEGRHPPVNYRIVDKAEGKTKNAYFREMLTGVLTWGLEPAFIAGNSRYSGVANLKRVRHHPLGFLFALESNRRVSVEKGTWTPIQKLDIPEEGREVWRRGFGTVKVFRTRLKEPVRHYAIHLPDGEPGSSFGRDQFRWLHDRHWQIEQYPRAIKQVCHVEQFQVRTPAAIQNHVFAAICGYTQWQRLGLMDVLKNGYPVQRNLFNGVIAEFVHAFMPGKEHLKPQFHAVVNA
jgi:hypothetical protein